jgi:hypothetical protein
MYGLCVLLNVSLANYVFFQKLNADCVFFQKLNADCVFYPIVMGELMSVCLSLLCYHCSDGQDAHGYSGLWLVSIVVCYSSDDSLMEVAGVGGRSRLRTSYNQAVVKSCLSCWALESIGNIGLSRVLARHHLIVHTRFDRSLDARVDLSRTSGGYGEYHEPSWKSWKLGRRTRQVSSLGMESHDNE